MARISRGITFLANDYLTAAKLHALIDTAIAAADAFPGIPSLYDVVMGDLLNTRGIHTAASPASPVTNDLAVGADGLLDRYAGSSFVDLATDYVFLVNGSSSTLVTGMPVIMDPASGANCKLWSTAGVCPEPFGVSMTVCAPSVTAKIQYRGLALVRVNSPLSVAVDDHLRISAGSATALSTTSSVLSDVLAIVVATDQASPLSGNALAMLVH